MGPVGRDRMVTRALIIAGAVAAFLVWAFVRGGARKETPPVVRRYREHQGDNNNVAQVTPEPVPAMIGETASPPLDGYLPFAGITDIDPEVCAMDAIVHALAPLEEDARGRILDWAASRYLADVVKVELDD